MLREVRYGIAVSLVNVTVAPLGVGSFAFHIGNVNVDYSHAAVAINVPGAGPVGFSLHGLTPSRHYQVRVCVCMCVCMYVCVCVCVCVWTHGCVVRACSWYR